MDIQVPKILPARTSGITYIFLPLLSFTAKCCLAHKIQGLKMSDGFRIEKFFWGKMTPHTETAGKENSTRCSAEEDTAIRSSRYLPVDLIRRGKYSILHMPLPN